MSAWEWTPEWLPQKEAAEAAGYHDRSLVRLALSGAVPTRMGPRPAWKRQGPAVVRFFHVPSLREYRVSSATRGAGQPRPREMRKSKTKLGAALQGWRLEKGWTQEDAAKAIGTTHDVLSRWEVGRQVPSVRLVVKLCELYDLSYQERWAVIEAIAWKQEQQ